MYFYVIHSLFFFYPICIIIFAMHYIIEYEIAAVLLSLAVIFSFFRKKIITNRLTNSFLLLIHVVLASAILDIISVLAISYKQTCPLWVLYLTNLLYYGTFTFFPFAFYKCICYNNSNCRKYCY